MKYVIYRAPDGPRISVFPAPTQHSEDAAAHPSWKPISAGFVEFIGGGNVRCFGFSESLRIGTGSQDESLIEVMMSATLKTCVFLPIDA